MSGEGHHHPTSGHASGAIRPQETVLGVSPLGCAALMAIPTLVIVGLAVSVVFFDTEIEGFLASGNPGLLIAAGGSPIYLVSDEAFPALLENKSPREAFESVSAAGQGVVVESGTRVLIIDIRLSYMRVRIQSGEHEGKAGWVLEDWVKPYPWR